MHRRLWWLSKSPRRHGKKMSKWLHLNKFKSNQENQIPVFCFKLIYPMNDWITLGSRTYIYFVNMKKEERGFDVIPFISTDVAVTSDDSQVFTSSPNIHSKKLIYIFNCQVSSTLVSFLDISNSACPKLNIWVYHVMSKTDLHSVSGSRIPIHSASWARNPGFIFVFANQVPRSMDYDPKYLCVWSPYSYPHIHCHDLHSSPCNLVSRLLN